MPNILGEGFSQKVIDQINVRQEKRGGDSSQEENVITWNNSKNVWIKLASSVNLAETQDDIKGSPLTAKQNVLFGSQMEYNQTDDIWSLFEGFQEKESSTYDKTLFGFRPRPTIKSAKISYLNNGSLRRAEISIKVYSPEQLEIIDKLFLRPQYSILLEWGHTIYFNNKKEYVTFNNFTTKPFNLFFKDNSNPDDILTAIKEEIEFHDGNYEAFYGQIMPSNWSFNTDGTYDINLTALSMGSIIESLKINKSLEKSSSTTEDTSNKPYIELSKDITLFHRFLYESTILSESEIKNKYSLNNKTFKLFKQEFKGNKSQGNLGNKNTNIQNYITLGGLLEYLEKHQNIITNDNKNLYLKYDYGEDNYCLSFNEHLSVDPTKCLIPFTFNSVTYGELKEFKVENNPYIGKLNYILINIEYLAVVLTQLMDKDKKVILFDFFEVLLEDINNSLGKINKMEVFYDSIDNKIKIVEKAPLKYGSLKSKGFARFNVYGVTPSEGSFVKSINFSVNIPKEFATLVAIGAQNNSNNQLGKNSVALSQINKGLIDRTIPKKLPTGEENIQPDKEPEQEYKQSVDKIQDLLKELYVNKLIVDENIQTLSSLVNDYSQIAIDKLSVDNQIPAPFFIPFNLSLTMDGLGGMKIYERFSLSETSSKILPPTYRTEGNKSLVDFIIKGITHSIESNKWTSHIDSQTIISESDTPIKLPIQTSPMVEEEGKCGPKSTVPIPVAISPLDSKRLDAITKSFNAVFGEFGEQNGMCAQWVYNLAVNYAQVIRNNNNIPQQKLNAGGNANQNVQYYNNLTKLGYSQYKVGSNINKNELSSTINNIQWAYGDILVYYANDGNKSESHIKYGHTQIYVGGLSTSKWASSMKNNYNSPFVYGSRNSNCWDLYVFRAPIN